MYGKHFQSAYTGSMMGAGADIFAVWGYVIAHAVNGHVEINPALLKTVIGMSEKRVNAAIEYLCAPDHNSRTEDEDGRRMVREGKFLYRVVNHLHYRGMANRADKQESDRVRIAGKRAAEKPLKSVVSQGVADSRKPSQIVEPVADVAYTDTDTESNTGKRKSRAIALPADFGLTEDRKAYAQSKGISSPEAEMEAFRAHHEAHGKTMTNWDAAWRTWCLNSKKFAGRGQAQQPASKPPKDFPA